MSREAPKAGGSEAGILGRIGDFAPMPILSAFGVPTVLTLSM
jgi:hypothetical protein